MEDRTDLFVNQLYNTLGCNKPGIEFDSKQSFVKDFNAIQI